MAQSEPEERIYDLIGLGFGPANLAIAGAVIEKCDGTDIKDGRHISSYDDVLFIEKQEEFRWHPGMLLPGAQMQISFLKDLATLRNPQSPITFLSYLQSQGRLLPFINRGSFTPSRKEYSDYLTWVSQYVQDRGVRVRYGEEVVDLSHGEDGTVEVHSRNNATGQQFKRRAKNIVISPGGSAKLPPVLSLLTPHPRIIHSSQYALSIDAVLGSVQQSMPTPRPFRIAIIGSGQSSSEILLDLHGRLKSTSTGDSGKHELDMIFRKGSLKPSDDSPFANEIFDPASTDMMYGLRSKYDRDHVLDEYKNTNYGVVNPRTIDAVYEVMYEQKLDEDIIRRTHRKDTTQVRINLRTYTNVYAAEDLAAIHDADDFTGPSCSPTGVRLTLKHTLSQAVTTKDYDIVFCGTGYDRTGWVRLLTSSDIGKHYGLHLSSAPVQLETSSEMDRQVVVPTFEMVDRKKDWLSSSSATDSSTSASPLSESDSLSHPHEHPSTKLYISRNYRLLPSSQQTQEAGIYLQGCTEMTHGISESLLSILGVRAGLVVDDICRRA